MKRYISIIMAIIAGLVLGSCNKPEEKLEVRKIYVDPESLVLGVGHTKTIIPTALPDRITDPVFEWKSDNENVATVDGDGNVTGVSVGKTVVYVTSGPITKDIPVTVYKPLTDIEIEPDSETLDLKIQNGVAVTVTLEITPVPADAEEKILYESSDNAVVTISSDGLVTPTGAGTAKLIIKGEGGVISKEISVTVTKSGEDAVLLDRTKFSFIYQVKGDNCQDMSEWWPMINIFDGNREKAGGTSPTSEVQSFTVDLGATVKLAYLHLFTWQGVYTDGPQFHPFSEKNIKYMEVFGSETLDTTGEWDKWTKLMDCKVIKPSGLPEGEWNEQDMKAWSEGQIFFTENYDTPVRYLRIRVNETWNGIDKNWRCSEMELYGHPVTE